MSPVHWTSNKFTMDMRCKLRDHAWIREPGPRAEKQEGLPTHIHALSLKACICSCVCVGRLSLACGNVGIFLPCVLLCVCASHAYTWACVKSLRACRKVHDWILESGEITRPARCPQERRDNLTEGGETMRPDPQDCRDILDPLLRSGETYLTRSSGVARQCNHVEGLMSGPDVKGSGMA